MNSQPKTIVSLRTDLGSIDFLTDGTYRLTDLFGVQAMDTPFEERAKEHLDSLVRELKLAKALSSVPGRLDELFDLVKSGLPNKPLDPSIFLAPHMPAEPEPPAAPAAPTQEAYQQGPPAKVKYPTQSRGWGPSQHDDEWTQVPFYAVPAEPRVNPGQAGGQYEIRETMQRLATHIRTSTGFSSTHIPKDVLTAMNNRHQQVDHQQAVTFEWMAREPLAPYNWAVVSKSGSNYHFKVFIYNPATVLPGTPMKLLEAMLYVLFQGIVHLLGAHERVFIDVAYMNQPVFDARTIDSLAMHAPLLDRIAQFRQFSRRSAF